MSYLDQQKLQAARHRHRQSLFRSNRLAAYNVADLADPREVARREAIQAAHDKARPYRPSKLAVAAMNCQNPTQTEKIFRTMLDQKGRKI